MFLQLSIVADQGGFEVRTSQYDKLETGTQCGILHSRCQLGKLYHLASLSFYLFKYDCFKCKLMCLVLYTFLLGNNVLEQSFSDVKIHKFI